MKLTYLYFLLIGNILVSSTGCDSNIEKTDIITKDNQSLIEMVKRDQEIREPNFDEPTEPIDQTHREKVFELLAKNEIKTNADKLNAALILQHTALTFCNGELKSINPENYLLAHKLSLEVFNNGGEVGNMVAITLDRYLTFTQGYQKYGTQQLYDEGSDSMYWVPIDSTTTDKERATHQVEPLKQLLKQAPMKDRK